MKKFKLFCLSLVALFASCTSTDENAVEATDQSTATRIFLNSVKRATNPLIPGSNNPVEICFTLVFPVKVIYNNGNVVTLNSMEGLKEAIYSENFTLHINSIVYPFSILSADNNDELVVQNEAQFLDLLSTCEEPTIDDILGSPTCFEFVFPLSVVKNNGSIQPIANATILNDLLSSMPTNEFWTDFQYPFQIIYGGNTVIINDIWGFFNYLDCTPQNSCICPTDYDPVCVQTANGVVQFANFCWAQCAGYASTDIIVCD